MLRAAFLCLLATAAFAEEPQLPERGQARN